MKTSIFIPLLFLAFNQLSAQELAVENMRSNEAFPLLDNRLKIIVQGVPCEKIVATTDNGKITQDGCIYNLQPDRIGIAIIFIKKVEGKDTILLEQRKFRVKPWPRPSKARLGGKLGAGQLRVAELKSQMGIAVPIEGTDICGNYTMVGYTIRLIRKNELIGKSDNKSGRFSDASQSLINSVQPGDKVIFENIFIMMPGEKEPYRMEDMVFDVK